MIGTLEDFLFNMESGVCDFTVNGQCSNCGQCCSGLLPISKKEIKAIRQYIEKHEIKEQTDDLQGDLTCPFRSDVEKKCLIYPVRPAICRVFQCDKSQKDIDADRDMYCGKYGETDLRAEFYGAEPVFGKAIQEMMQNKG